MEISNLAIRLWLLMFIFTPAVAQYQSPAALVRAGHCPKTAKAWSESPLPVQSLQVAGQKLDLEGIRQHLKASSGLRAGLMRELVAAKLNLVVGVEFSAVSLSVDRADRWLRGRVSAETWAGGLQDTLEAFNQGRYGVCR